MPDVAAALRTAPLFGLVGAVDFPQNALSGSNLVGAYHQEGVICIKDGILQQHTEQGVFLKKGSGKVFEIFDEAVIGFGPVHRKVEAISIALGGVGKVAGIGAVGNNEELQIFIERMFGIKAFFAVAMHLVKGFSNGDTTFFKLYLYEGQAVDQNGDIVAVGLGSCLLKLLDDLGFVAG